MLIIFATIMTLTTPTGQLSPDHALIYLGVWRIILGIGVGGDYPMSASVTSDRANLRKRLVRFSFFPFLAFRLVCDVFWSSTSLR
jgi:PHS family inorganic phosphate transporter-like MFS transporter